MGKLTFEEYDDKKYEGEYKSRLEFYLKRYEEKKAKKEDTNIDELIGILKEIVENYSYLDINSFEINEQDFKAKKEELKELKDRRNLQTDKLAQEAARLKKDDGEGR